MNNFSKWEYKVIHVNVDNQPEHSVNNDPKIASKKLQGSLSPDFIETQFPAQYKKKESPIHPAAQLSKFLNKTGSDGWELIETFELDKRLMFVFKRQKKTSAS